MKMRSFRSGGGELVNKQVVTKKLDILSTYSQLPVFFEKF